MDGKEFPPYEEAWCWEVILPEPDAALGLGLTDDMADIGVCVKKVLGGNAKLWNEQHPTSLQHHITPGDRMAWVTLRDPNHVPVVSRNVSVMKYKECVALLKECMEKWKQWKQHFVGAELAIRMIRHPKESFMNFLKKGTPRLTKLKESGSGTYSCTLTVRFGKATEPNNTTTLSSSSASNPTSPNSDNDGGSSSGNSSSGSGVTGMAVEFESVWNPLEGREAGVDCTDIKLVSPGLETILLQSTVPIEHADKCFTIFTLSGREISFQCQNDRHCSWFVSGLNGLAMGAKHDDHKTREVHLKAKESSSNSNASSTVSSNSNDLKTNNTTNEKTESDNDGKPEVEEVGEEEFVSLSNSSSRRNSTTTSSVYDRRRELSIAQANFSTFISTRTNNTNTNTNDDLDQQLQSSLAPRSLPGASSSQDGFTVTIISVGETSNGQTRVTTVEVTPTSDNSSSVVHRIRVLSRPQCCTPISPALIHPLLPLLNITNSGNAGGKTTSTSTTTTTTQMREIQIVAVDMPFSSAHLKLGVGIGERKGALFLDKIEGGGCLSEWLCKLSGKNQMLLEVARGDRILACDLMLASQQSSSSSNPVESPQVTDYFSFDGHSLGRLAFALAVKMLKTHINWWKASPDSTFLLYFQKDPVSLSK